METLISLERRNYTVFIDDFRECIDEDFQVMPDENPDKDDIRPVLGTMKRYIDSKVGEAVDKGTVIPGFESLYRIKMTIPSTDEVKAIMRAFANVLNAVTDKEAMQRLEEPIIVRYPDGREKYRFTTKQKLFKTVKRQANIQLGKRRDERGEVSFISESTRTIIPACNNTVDGRIADYYYKRDLSDYMKLGPEEKIDTANRFYANHKVPYLVYPTDDPPTKGILRERLIERLSQYPRNQKLAIYRRLSENNPELFGLPELKAS
jgi:hypothetical protein